MWNNNEIDGALALQLVLERERGLDEVVRDSAGRRVGRLLQRLPVMAALAVGSAGKAPMGGGGRRPRA